MASLREWARRLWGTLRPRRRDADLEEELRSHLALAAEHTRRHGRPAEDPDRAAVIRVGALAQSMDAVRDQRGLPWLDDVARDLRYGVRAVRRNPVFAAVAVVTLALGIGANTAIFSLADAVLRRTLPVSRPRNLVVLRQRGPGGDIFPFTSSAADQLAASRDALAGLAAFRPVPNAHVGVNGETELAWMQAVSDNYHAVLGVRTILGHALTEGTGERDAVISYRYWRRRFGADPNVVGRVIEIQGRSFTIAGVTPSDFFGTQPGRHVDVTVPLRAQVVQLPPQARWLFLIGRLAPGVSREQARAALRVRWAQIASRTPAILDVDSGAQGLNELRREFSRPLQILMAAVTVVLLVACANLAGLLIVRASTRQQEFAVRLSLGAGRGRIVRQLLTESALLAAAGGVAGVFVACWTTNVLLALLSRGRSPIALDSAPDARMLAYAAVITMIATMLFGLLPAITAGRIVVHSRLKLGAAGLDRATNAWGETMVAAQIALLVLLLASAGLFVRTLQKLESVEAGFRRDEVLLVSLSPGPAYRGAAARALYEELLGRFTVVTGVRSVSLSMDTPFGGQPSMSSTGLSVVGRPAEDEHAPRVYHNLVGPHFFETMGIPILAGRDFGMADDERAPARVIISDSVARRYFTDEDPLGRQILFGGPVLWRAASRPF